MLFGTGWDKTRKALGIERTSLGSLSEAANVFYAQFVEPIIRELANKAVPRSTGREAEALQGLTAVDGSIFTGLSRMAWALWPDDDHRGVKLHRHFDVPKGVPRHATVTPAACSEPAALMRTLEPNRLPVLDRGYASYELFAELIAANSSLVTRVKDTTAFAVKEEPSIPPAAPAAGVIRDVMKRSMRSRPEAHYPHPVTTNPPTDTRKPPPVPHPTPDRNQCAEQY